MAQPNIGQVAAKNEFGHNVNPMTLNRFILNTCDNNPGRGADLAFILNSMSVACKVIANAVTMSGLQSTHSLSGQLNSTGDDQKALDVISNDVMINAMINSRTVAAMVSEENEAPILLTSDTKSNNGQTKYCVVFDPLDGSSNIECNVSVGTIFGIYECIDSVNPTIADCLQNGNKMICAGYVLYSSSCIMVLSMGLEKGVHSFTQDPTFGEFVTTGETLKIPEKSKRIYSINAGNSEVWDLPTSEFVRWTKRQKDRYSLRYIGSMVADVHRTLLYGGIFMYPADFFNREGKLRLIYECFPMAFLVEAAGGMASTGRGRILDLTPTSIHQRSPIFLGCKRDVSKIEELYSRIPILYGMHFSPLESERSVMHSPTRTSRSRRHSKSEEILPLPKATAKCIEPNNHWAISIAKFYLLEDFEGSDENFELSGRKNEIFCDVCKMNDARWVLASNMHAQRGLLPSRLLAAMPSDNDHEIAISDFVGDPENNEIDFKKGDIAINIRQCNDARWHHVRNASTGISGIVPAIIFDHLGRRKRFTSPQRLKQNTEGIKKLSEIQNLLTPPIDRTCKRRAETTPTPLNEHQINKFVLVENFIGDEDNFELSGSKGDTFKQVQVLADERWVRAEDSEGNRGVLPKRLLKPTKQQVEVQVAISNFEGYEETFGCEGYNNFKKGEIAIDIHEFTDPKWVFATNAKTGAKGIVPKSIFQHDANKVLSFENANSLSVCDV